MTTIETHPAIVPNFDEETGGSQARHHLLQGQPRHGLPGLVLANAALGEGVETHLFFTFWGFDMIIKSRMDHLQFCPAGNTAMHLPIGDAHLPQALMPLPGMTAMATKMLKKQIAELGVPEVPEFLDQIVAAGGHLWACRMSADMNHGRGRPTRRRRGHHQRLRLHREDRRRPAAVHLTNGSTPHRAPRGRCL